MKLKQGVKLDGLTPQCVLGMVIVNDCFWRHGAEGCTLTSVNDSTHSATSWHYKGRAFDVRTKDFYGDKDALVRDIKESLGPNFDVVLEGAGTDNEHLHVEYDPKA